MKNFFLEIAAKMLPRALRMVDVKAVLIAFASIAMPVHAASNTSEFVSQVEHTILKPRVAEAPGAAAILVVDGKVVLQKAWGLKHAAGADKINHDTLFRLASVSKTFASAAASILVKETDLSWQTPVISTVGGLNFKRTDYGDRINLAHLMSQSTGLIPHAYTNLVETNLSYKQILSRLDKVDFVCPPGKCYGYQNVVFSLVGDLVKAKTGKSYAQFVDDKIFTPLDMQRASFGKPAFAKDQNHATPHVWNGKSWSKTATKVNYYRIPPAAGVNASINDMRAWLLAQLGQNPDVLSLSMLDDMQTGVISTTRQQAHYRYHKGISNVHYGLGWRTFDYGKQKGFVQHGGYVKGMRAEMMFNRELQTGLVFLTNSEPKKLTELVFEYLDLYQLQYGIAQDVQAAE